MRAYIEAQVAEAQRMMTAMFGDARLKASLEEAANACVFARLRENSASWERWKCCRCVAHCR